MPKGVSLSDRRCNFFHPGTCANVTRYDKWRTFNWARIFEISRIYIPPTTGNGIQPMHKLKCCKCENVELVQYCLGSILSRCLRGFRRTLVLMQSGTNDTDRHQPLEWLYARSWISSTPSSYYELMNYKFIIIYTVKISAFAGIIDKMFQMIINEIIWSSGSYRTHATAITNFRMK